MQRMLMASVQQTRIQSYLEKNKIGPLFEVCYNFFTKDVRKAPRDFAAL